MTLLTVCQDAAVELKIAKPGSVAASSGPNEALLFRLARKSLKALSKRAYWSFLRKEWVFDTTADDDQGNGSLPPDFSWMVPETMFNRTLRREVYGPISPQDWQQYKARLIYPTNPAYLIRGGNILLAPLQADGHQIAFEYQSRNIVKTEAGPTGTTYVTDGDTAVGFPEELLTLDLIVRWREQKGLDSTNAALDFERQLADFLLRDGGKPRVDLSTISGSTAFRRGRAGMSDYDTIPVT